MKRKKVNNNKVTTNIVLRVEEKESVWNEKRKHKRPRNTETLPRASNQSRCWMLKTGLEERRHKRERKNFFDLVSWMKFSHTHTEPKASRAKLSYESFFFYARVVYVSLLVAIFLQWYEKIALRIRESTSLNKKLEQSANENLWNYEWSEKLSRLIAQWFIFEWQASLIT